MASIWAFIRYHYGFLHFRQSDDERVGMARAVFVVLGNLGVFIDDGGYNRNLVGGIRPHTVVIDLEPNLKVVIARQYLFFQPPSER